MKVLFLNTELSFSVIPRKYPAEIEDILVTLKNENTGEYLTPSFSFTVDEKLNITLDSQPQDFRSQNKYEVEIKNGSEIIYLGKIIVLEEETDVQNYEYGSQTNTRFKYQ